MKYECAALLNRPVGVYQNGLPARSAKIYALQNARKLCSEWGIGDIDARTMAYKVAAAAKPPQTTPL
jgi:hypothetical protein